MIEGPDKSKASRWDTAGALLLATLVGAWLLAYAIVAIRAWLGAQ